MTSDMTSFTTGPTAQSGQTAQPGIAAELVSEFEEQRPRLRGIAYRMLGSHNDAEDAVQEAWLRLQRSEVETIDNLAGWLTVVVSRICLDLLRARGARPERSMAEVPELVLDVASGSTPGVAPIGGTSVVGSATTSPEEIAVQADAVGAALVVVLDTLGPAERLAFVLHDLFGLPFDEIAPIVGKTPAATRQLASRARRRVRGAEPVAERDRQRRVVEAFLAASREGDFGRLLQLLDPEVELRATPDVVAYANANAHRGAPLLGESVSGADAVARVFAGRAKTAVLALVDGAPAFVWAPGGVPRTAFAVQLRGDRVVGVEVIGDPVMLAELEIVLE